MTHRPSAVSAVAIPVESAVNRFCAAPNLADAFAVQLPDGSATDPELLARFVFASQPAWVSRLMSLRDVLVSPFGLKTAAQLTTGGAGSTARRIGIFRIYATSADEIVLGEDDSHLDFRLSVLCTAPQQAPGRQSTLTIATVVRCNNRLGRLYILLIAPFHRAVVRAYLNRAADIGWPRATSG